MAHLPIATPGSSVSTEPFTWFVYASSLDDGALAAWCGDHGYSVPDLSHAVPGRLDGYRLSFNVQSRFWGGAVASLVEHAGGRVEGIGVSLPGSARKMVDHKEGAVSGLYVPFQVGVQPLDGSAALAALAFRGAADRVGPEQPPSPAFLETVIRGAVSWKLSEAWIAELSRLAAR